MATLQQILQNHGNEFLSKSNLSFHKRKIFKHILECRTEKYGRHIDICEHCEYVRGLYNSCKDRNCPQCQTFKKEDWINERKSECIDCKYFHVVLTLPKELDLITMQNQELIYNLMFKSASKSIKKLSSDKKFLGAMPGFIAILHTWGQTMEFHPHLHLIVTGGGLNSLNKWNESSKNFFIPVKALSKIFKAIFLKNLIELYNKNKLNFYGDAEIYKNAFEFNNLTNSLYCMSWYSYCKKTFNGPATVIEYLGRYTHRIAISNNRIKKIENGKVHFYWKDYKDNLKIKEMVLDVNEFLRRYFLHVLPSGFIKIRYFGIWANVNKKTKLVRCQKITKCFYTAKHSKLTKLEILMKITNNNVFVCPCCGENKLKRFSDWRLSDSS